MFSLFARKPRSSSPPMNKSALRDLGLAAPWPRDRIDSARHLIGHQRY